ALKRRLPGLRVCMMAGAVRRRGEYLLPIMRWPVVQSAELLRDSVETGARAIHEPLHPPRRLQRPTRTVLAGRRQQSGEAGRWAMPRRYVSTGECKPSTSIQVLPG